MFCCEDERGDNAADGVPAVVRIAPGKFDVLGVFPRDTSCWFVCGKDLVASGSAGIGTPALQAVGVVSPAEIEKLKRECCPFIALLSTVIGMSVLEANGAGTAIVIGSGTGGVIDARVVVIVVFIGGTEINVLTGEGGCCT